MFNVNDIFYLDEQYAERAEFCNASSEEHRLVIIEIEPDENGRRFQIQEVPPPSEEEILNQLRYQRDIECFPIINRGILWYDTLTDSQKEELKVWYQAWLKVTDTLVVPEKPVWLK